VDVTVTEQGSRLVLVLNEPPALYRIFISEHGLRDLEFVLAQRRAMSRRCTVTRDAHTCSLDPGHATDHLCRGCITTWQVRPDD
jgi:hypothetical protein